MLFDLSQPLQAIDADTYLQQLHEQGARIEIVKKSSRTLSQNSYLHCCLAYYASEFGLSLEEVKVDTFKRTVNKRLFSGTRTNKRGEQVTYLRSTRELSSEEMTEAIERFRNYSATIAGLYIPSPDEHRTMFAAQQQIDNYKQYL